MGIETSTNAAPRHAQTAQGHTPVGPWTIRKHPNSDIWIVSKPGHRTELLRRSEAAAIVARDRENEAFARNKIKDAAPDMLAALKACVEMFGDHEPGADDWTAIVKARAAIAQAEGRG